MALPALRRWNQTAVLHHVHIQKCAGSAVDAFFAERRIVAKYHGYKHFDVSCVDDLANIIFVARDPAARAVSHFHYAKHLPWTAGFPRIRAAASLGELIAEDRGNHFWRDGEGLGFWLAGVYAKPRYHCEGNATALMEAALAEKALAAMVGAAWFAILERPLDSDVLFRRVFDAPWAALPTRNDNPGARYGELAGNGRPLLDARQP